MRLDFGSKVIKVEVLDEHGRNLVTSEKGFKFPANTSDDDDVILIKGKDLPDLERNTIVSIVITTKSADRIKLSGAVSVSLDKQLNIKVLSSNNTQVLQERRRYFKIKIKEKGRALFYVRDEENHCFDEPLEIEIMDINVGGIFMSCPGCEFERDDLVCVEVYLFREYPLNAAARVLRVQRNEEGEIVGYGCEFQGLTGAQEDYISRFVLKVQTEKRLKDAGNTDLA